MDVYVVSVHDSHGTSVVAVYDDWLEGPALDRVRAAAQLRAQYTQLEVGRATETHRPGVRGFHSWSYRVRVGSIYSWSVDVKRFAVQEFDIIEFASRQGSTG